MKATMKPETIKELIDKYEGEDTGDYIKSIIEKDIELRRRKESIRRELNQSKEVYELAKKRVDSQQILLIQDCPHWEVSFFGDPSGNNDSYRVCDLCGKQW